MLIVILAVACYLAVYAMALAPHVSIYASPSGVMRLRHPSYLTPASVSKYAFCPLYRIDTLVRSSYWMEIDEHRIRKELPEHAYDVDRSYVVTGMGGAVTFDGKNVRVQLQGCNVGDTDLSRLEEFGPITDMDVRNTSVSITGLAQIARCTALEHLCVSGASATQDALNDLRSQLPNCSVLVVD